MGFLCPPSKKRGYIVLLMLVCRLVGSADYLKYHLSQSSYFTCRLVTTGSIDFGVTRSKDKVKGGICVVQYFLLISSSVTFGESGNYWLHYEGWERKRSKRFFTYVRLDHFTLTTRYVHWKKILLTYHNGRLDKIIDQLYKNQFLISFFKMF